MPINELISQIALGTISSKQLYKIVKNPFSTPQIKAMVKKELLRKYPGYDFIENL